MDAILNYKLITLPGGMRSYEVFYCIVSEGCYTDLQHARAENGTYVQKQLPSFYDYNGNVANQMLPILTSYCLMHDGDTLTVRVAQTNDPPTHYKSIYTADNGKITASERQGVISTKINVLS